MKKALAIVLAITLLICACSFAVYAEPVSGLASDPGCNGSFLDTLDWGEIYEYAWDNEGNALLGEWPGTKLTNKVEDGYGRNRFSLLYPEGMKGIVLSAKLADNNFVQTVDIENPDYKVYYLDGTKDNTGHYNVRIQTDEELPSAPVSSVVTVADSHNWNSAFLYAWDANDNAICGDWPGTYIEPKTTYPTGETAYSFLVPYNAKGFLLNSGNGEQSEDIENFNEISSFRIGNEKNDLGFYKVSQFNSTQTAPVLIDRYIQFTDTMRWGKLYLHAWNDEGDSLCGDWPGAQVIDKQQNGFGEDVYICGIPEDAAGIVLSNGSNYQTEDITNFYDNEFCWLSGKTDDLGHYLVTNMYNQDYTIPTEPTTKNPNDETILEIKDNLGWGEAYLYAWDEEGNALLGEWPGTQVETGLDYYDQNHFLCHIPANAVGIVINNGKGAQSEDITDFDRYYYWFDGTQNELGHYLVTPYYGEEDDPTEPTGTTAELPEPGAFTLGDVSGDGIITVADATLVQQCAAEMITLDGSALAAADTNHDGIVTVADATLIQQYAAEMIDSF